MNTAKAATSAWAARLGPLRVIRSCRRQGRYRTVDPNALAPGQQDCEDDCRRRRDEAPVAFERGNRQRHSGDRRPCPEARAERDERLRRIPGGPAQRHQHCPGHRCNRRSGEQQAVHYPAPRTQNHGQIEHRPYQQKAAQVNLPANMLPGVKRQFAQYPRGKQQQREHLLGLVMQQGPSGKRRDGPQQDGRRPVFFDIEDLPHQRDRGARGDGAHCVQRRGHRTVLVADQAPPR